MDLASSGFAILVVEDGNWGHPVKGIQDRAIGHYRNAPHSLVYSVFELHLAVHGNQLGVAAIPQV